MQDSPTYRCALRLLTGLLFLCTAATANSIIVATGVGWSRGGSMMIREDGADIQAYFADVIFISLTEGGQVYNRDSLCVDLFTDIFLGQQDSADILTPNDVPGKNLGRASWLVENALLPGEDSFYSSSLDPADWVFNSVQGHGSSIRHLGHRPRQR